MNLKEKYREFKEWQLRPYQVAPLIPQEHTCATCGPRFKVTIVRAADSRHV